MATINWKGGNGDWNTASDWDTGTVPGPSDDAVIAASLHGFESDFRRIDCHQR